MYTVGIDLGTTFTAAAVWRQGRAEICTLGTRGASIPSVVWMRDDDSILTGEAANRRALIDPQRVAREFKRRFGDSTPVLLAGSPYSPEALTARLLSAVVEQVTQSQGAPPDRICISHPANWGSFKTDLLRHAIRLANLEMPVSYATEPEAAAVFYARDQRVAVGDTVAVYDLGGGTFDAAVLRRTSEGFTILGQPEGIERLGGIDIDAAVFGHVVSAVRDAFSQLDEDDPAAITAVARLRQECTDAKEALSSDTDVSIPVILPGFSTEVRLTRAELESMVRPSLYDSIEALRRALRSADVEAAELATVLLVGGTSRMPLVAQLVGGELGRPVALDAHPKHAVALGAAWLASGTPLPGDTGAVRIPTSAPAPPPAPVATEVVPVVPVPAPVATEVVPVVPVPAPVATDVVPVPEPAPAAPSAVMTARPAGLGDLAGTTVQDCARAAAVGAGVGVAAGAVGLASGAALKVMRAGDPPAGSPQPAPAATQPGAGPAPAPGPQPYHRPASVQPTAPAGPADFAGDYTMAHPLRYVAPAPTRVPIGRRPVIAAALASVALAVALAGWLVLRPAPVPTRLVQSVAMTSPSASTSPTPSRPQAVTVARASSAAPMMNLAAPAPSTVASTGRLLVGTRVSGGTGRVRSDDGRIDCPGRCTAQYPPTTTVTIRAVGTGFLGWSGCPQPNWTACTLSGNASFGPVASYRTVAAPVTTTPRAVPTSATTSPTTTTSVTTTVTTSSTSSPTTSTWSPPTTSTATSTTTTTPTSSTWTGLPGQASGSPSSGLPGVGG